MPALFSAPIAAHTLSLAHTDLICFLSTGSLHTKGGKKQE